MSRLDPILLVLLSTIFAMQFAVAKPSQALLRQDLKLAQKRLDSLVSEEAVGNLTETNKSKTAIQLNSDVLFTVSGVINQAAFYADDHYSQRMYYGTNENYNTRLDLDILAKRTEQFTFGGDISFGLKANPTDTVSQMGPSVTLPIDIRKSEVYIKTPKYGDLYLGKGYCASFLVPAVDLSGTDILAAASTQEVGGGLYFRSFGDTRDFIPSNQVKNSFDDLDEIVRAGRIRYDSPNYNGFHLQTSVIDSGYSDIAIMYDRTFEKLHLSGGISYTSPITYQDVDGNILAGSISGLFTNGWNLTIASGEMFAHNEHDNSISNLVSKRQYLRQNPSFYYAKLGYQAHLIDSGKTDFSVDYGNTKDFAMNDDNGKTYALAIVQKLDKYHFSLYAGYREFTLLRANVNFKHIGVASFGGFFEF